MDRAEEIIRRAELAGAEREARDRRDGFDGFVAMAGRLIAENLLLKSAIRTLYAEAQYGAALRQPRVQADHYCFASTIGEIAVLVEYASHPSIDLRAIWINGRSCADLASTFQPQQLNRWLDEARRHDYRLMHALPDAVEPSPVELTGADVAAAEDRFIAQRDAASYQQVAQ
jgi:hypothetical protein